MGGKAEKEKGGKGRWISEGVDMVVAMLEADMEAAGTVVVALVLVAMVVVVATVGVVAMVVIKEAKEAKELTGTRHRPFHSELVLAARPECLNDNCTHTALHAPYALPSLTARQCVISMCLGEADSQMTVSCVR